MATAAASYLLSGVRESAMLRDQAVYGLFAAIAGINIYCQKTGSDARGKADVGVVNPRPSRDVRRVFAGVVEPVGRSGMLT